jgi:hypothetical protein
LLPVTVDVWQPCLYLYKANSYPLALYTLIFLIFPDFPSPLDSCHLKFSLLSILSLKENLYSCFVPFPLSHSPLFSFLTVKHLYKLLSYILLLLTS